MIDEGYKVEKLDENLTTEQVIELIDSSMEKIIKTAHKAFKEMKEMKENE
jgi:hypothetical protein